VTEFFKPAINHICFAHTKCTVLLREKFANFKELYNMSELCVELG